MNEYRYILERGSKKHNCHECGKKKLVRYVDTVNGEYLPDHYGRCDSETSCGYHLNPYKNGYAKSIAERERGDMSELLICRQSKKRAVPALPSFIPFEVLKATRKGWDQNTFIQNLLSRIPFPFETKDIERVIVQYQLGTVGIGYRAGAVTFPFIDERNNIRAIQVKQFDEMNHTTGTDFLHSIIEKGCKEKNKAVPAWLESYSKNNSKVSCLFGANLLSKYPSNPVALVEAPKGAIIGTLYFGFPATPDKLLWLAVYNLSSLTIEKCKVLEGRNVILFPDLSGNGKAFQSWSDKAKEFTKQMPGTIFTVSDLLERKASVEDKNSALDIADYLIQLDWRLFRDENSLSRPENHLVETEAILVISVTEEANLIPKIEKIKEHPVQPTHYKPLQTENWETEITELETFYRTANIPASSIKLNGHSSIIDVPLFINKHLTYVKGNNGNTLFRPYLERLSELRGILMNTPP